MRVQVVIGPPGSGKSTYCFGMKQMLQGLGRKCYVVNIDPANDNPPYEADLDISELISLADVQDKFDLGPNGGLVYCMEFLGKNQDWLISGLKKWSDNVSEDESEKAWIIIDCPGQSELFINHDALKSVIMSIAREYLVCVLNLVDAAHCSDSARYLSVLILSLQSMLHLELPQINILSKCDLIEESQLDFNLEFYTEVQDLNYLLNSLDRDRFGMKYRSLNHALVNVLNDFSLVGFHTLKVMDKESMYTMVELVDGII